MTKIVLKTFFIDIGEPTLSFRKFGRAMAR